MDTIPINSKNLLANFHPKLRGQIQELLLGDRIVLNNLSHDDILLFPDKFYGLNETDLPYSYHFKLRIPYAGKRLDWDVVFNPEDLYFAPDFDTADDVFSVEDIDILAKHLPTWTNWDTNDNKSLSKVMREFINFYKKYQINKLKTDNIYSKILSEYEKVLENGLTFDDIELIVENNSVHFLFQLSFDCSSLPEYLQMGQVVENPGEDTANLRISFNKLDGSQVVPLLYLSPRLDQVLGGAKQLHLPRYCKDYTLWEYINKIVSMLKNLVQEVEHSYQLRKEFITYVVANFCDRLTEYDADTFSRAEFMFDMDDFPIIVTFNLGQRFPREKPIITITSCFCEGKPCMEIVDNFPYKPHLKIDEMVERILIAVTEAILQIKSHKHSTS